MSSSRLRILHTSDLHLGDPFGRPGPLRHSADCLCTLDALARAAETAGAGLLLIAGDLFDHARVPDRLLSGAAATLAALPVPVIVLPGNHDHFAGDSLYRRRAWRQASAGVHVLTSEAGETLRFPDLGLTIWGRAVHDHSPDHRPLRGAPARPKGDWYVVVAHGHYLEPRELGSGWPPRSSPILPDDLHGLTADYVALGHWDVCTRVGDNGLESWYSGAPALGGRPGTAMLVTLEPGARVRVEALPLQAAGDRCPRQV